MSDNMAGSSTSKAVAVAEQLNGILFELIQRCSKSHSEPPRPYFGVSVVGYNTDQSGRALVGSRLSGGLSNQSMVWTTDLALNPLRIEERLRKDADPDATAIRYKSPVWLDPVAGGGTPMCQALDMAGRTIRSWVDSYPDGFPPIVINLTDGESTDGNPHDWAERIRGLSTTDGNVLLFNVGISSGGASSPVMFPSNANSVAPGFGRSLFEMSSELPRFMLDAARASQGFSVPDGARGFALDADLRAVMTFLNVGTMSFGSLLR